MVSCRIYVGFVVLFPKQCGHTRGSCGRGKARGRDRLIRCYLQHIHDSRNPRSAFRLRRLTESGCPWRVLLTTVLSLWCRVHFRTRRSLFVAGARETSCFGAPKSTCRDRCKGSELFYFSWQVQHFMNLDAQISWQPQHFVNLGLQISWQAKHLVMAGTALGEPRSAVFVAGTALGEPRNADFVAGTAFLGSLECRFRGRHGTW